MFALLEGSMLRKTEKSFFLRMAQGNHQPARIKKQSMKQVPR